MSVLGGIEDVGAGLNLGYLDSTATTIDSYSIDNMLVGETGTGNYNTLGKIDTGASSYYGAAIGAVTTIASTLLSVAAKKDAMEQRTKEIVSSMDATVEEFDFMASVNEQQMAAVERVVGDKMSKTGLDRLKNKASLRASAAMTGVAGGTNENVIQEASIIEMMDNAVIVAQGRQQKTQLTQKIQGQYMSAQNRLNNLAAGIQSSSGAAFAMIDAGLSGFTKGYMMLPKSEREKFFSFNS